GNAQPIIVTLTKGQDLASDFLMTGSATATALIASTFDTPAKLPPTDWRGTLSGYGDVDYYRFTARANRTMVLKVTALDESNKPTQEKSQPVLGIWADSDTSG